MLHWRSFSSLADFRRFSSPDRLMFTAFVGVVELNPPRVNVTVLFVVRDAESSYISVLNPRRIYLTE